jgi:Sulfate permease family
VLPIEWSRVPADLLAGPTLTALGVPEVLGYARIAGMPLVTGLYTMLLPMAALAVLGSSRHLVVATLGIQVAAGHLRWMVFDWAAIGGRRLHRVRGPGQGAGQLRRRQVRLVFRSVLDPVRQQLERYGISPDACYETPGEALEAFRAAHGGTER